MSYEMDGVRHIGGLSGRQDGRMSQRTFATKVMPIFGLALAMTAAGAYLGAGLPRAAYIPIVIAELALVFTSGMWQRKEGLNNILFFVYALLSGMTLVPILAWAGHIGGIALVMQALAVSTVTFGACAVFGLSTKRDFSGMGTFLLLTCVGLIVASLLGAFVFHSSVFTMAITVVGVGLFSAFTVYDMNQIRNNYLEVDYVGAALALYIDFIGLFTYVLRFFGLWGGRDD
jgi:FtsH-binding integral membrane protein